MPKKSTFQKKSSNGQCPVVGIGASAGGLEAFTQLVEHLPVDSEMSFVLVQHMDPTHESLLPKLLSKVTTMPVEQVADRTPIEPNHIYVIPPNVNMSLEDGQLRLTPRPQTIPMPIDYFLRSLAQSQKNKAIGVILSGTGSDGVLGLTAIKAEGGITFAQDEKTAKYNGMPHSAIVRGVVDFALPPAEIAKEIARIGCHPYVSVTATAAPNTDEAELEDQKDLQKIFAALRTFKGVDFSFYKPSTFQRRLARRMAVLRIEGISRYVDYLHKHPKEVDELYKDVLIHVTRFFRDPKVFQALEKIVFPRLLKDRPKGTPIRIWVPGCSTGEEVYSIGMALLDFLGDRASSYPIQLFATDLSEEVLTTARAGQFVENIAADLSPDRVRRYFEKSDGGYRVARSVRDLCTFAKHNLLSDPPFSRLDLISCRNVVIYWEPVLQKRIAPLFHYALGPKGFLMLGTAESVRTFTSLFEPLDQEHQIYAKRIAAGRTEFSPEALHQAKLMAAPSSFQPFPARKIGTFDAGVEADHAARRLYSPPALLVNNDLDIIQFRGQVSPYIGPMPGKASFKLLQMVQRNLGQDLAALIDQVRSDGAPAKKSNVPFEIQGQEKSITIRVVPLTNESSTERFFVIFFEENSPAVMMWESNTSPDRRAKPMTSAAAVLECARLRKQLVALEATLQLTVEKSDALHEELLSANEEILSANEELQAGNEELETTKEELQSTNEELMTLNAELKSSVDEAYQARDRGQRIIDTVRQPLLVLDPNLRVLQANQTFLDTYKMSSEATENQLLYDLLRGQWNVPELRKLLEKVLPEQHSVKDFEITRDFQDMGPRTMLLNARQILRSDGARDRILLSMEDVTESREVQRKLAEQNRDLQELSETLETRVGDRSRELAASQNALQQARQLEAIGRLAGGVAHDFNNLMTGILGMAEDLQAELLPTGDSEDDLKAIIDAAKKASALTKQLLAFGRRQVFTPRILNLNQIIEGMKPLFQRFIGENTEFITTLASELGMIKGDQSQLEQVVLNLVVNSRDAMPRGGQVTIETANIELTPEMLEKHFDIKAGPYVRLTVSDTGFGMDVETLHRIFEPFFSTKEQGKGTGLGLATTYGIVKQHEADISVYSEPGHGTTFKIYFPLVNDKRGSERRIPLDGGALIGTETILVVEDEDIVRRVTTKGLRKAGYHILEARSGPEAIELLSTKTEPVHLLLTDVIMPGMDGSALAQKLLVLKPQMKVLYMSGYPKEVIVHGGILDSGISFIEKSFSAEMLCKRVREVLDNSENSPVKATIS